jgi:diguanylate cyclase (GGDEF)-like protein
MTSKSIRSFLMRHKFAIRDLSLIFAGTLVALYIAYAVDIFLGEGTVGPQEAKIELDEALLIGTLLGIALLVFAARQYFGQRRELARRVTAERRIRELAYQDGLTGLPNRRQFDDALRTAIAAPPRAGAAHGVFLMDLNGFKQINDVHGHGVGDEVLAEVAQRMLSAMREGDMVARFGGDEFAILATHLAGPEAATNIALRVIEGLNIPIQAGGAVHRVGVGIGIALVPSDAATVVEALRKADIALYRAKAERRSALRFFEPEMDARVKSRSSMEAALREAIEAGRIEAVFQPTVNLRTHAVVGFDVTPRWLGPDDREVPLEQFIAIAEEVGLIHALAEKILRQACASAVAWPSDVRIAVDIYPSQLKDSMLPARILRILADSGLPTSRLELDITESALVADIDGAQMVLAPLRAAGVRIALDHFGTGYSSLYHLRNFRMDKVKIDRSFVERMRSEPESAGIVAALAGLGQGFNLTIAAEGVDLPGIESALLSTGCEEGQGALFDSMLSAMQANDLFSNLTVPERSVQR